MTYASSIRPSLGRGVPSARLAETPQNRKSGGLLAGGILQVRAASARTAREHAGWTDTRLAQAVFNVFAPPPRFACAGGT